MTTFAYELTPAHWLVASADIASPELDRLLGEGWEPFGTFSDDGIALRKYVERKAEVGS